MIEHQPIFGTNTSVDLYHKQDRYSQALANVERLIRVESRTFIVSEL